MHMRKVVGLAALISLGACTGPSDNQNQPQVAASLEADKPGSMDTCPANSFDEFLKKYASDAGIRTRYTAPTVAVTDYKDPDSLDEQVLVVHQVPRADYNDFTLRYESSAYHNVDAAGQIDPAPVEVRIEGRGANYYVSYIYGMSEGNSWIFQKRDSCWYLAEDPDPPSA